MRWNYQKKAGTFSAKEDGVVAVEFMILLPLFMLILVGIIEFGNLFYVRHTLTNASREGARAAVVYFDTDRVNKARTEATTVVDNYLNPGGKPRLPGVTLTVPPPAVSGSTSGSTITVTITATNVVLVLHKLLSAFNNISVSAETTMRME